jgi:pyruvate dehydrogenase E1 component
MFFQQEDVFYYITLMNENYEMPILPMGSTEGICRGIYRLSTRDSAGRATGSAGAARPRVRLLGSGAILRESLRAQELLEQHFGVGSDVFSVTSYKNLYYDGRECDRWNRLHPKESPRQPFVAKTLAEGAGPVVAALDYASAVGLSIAPWAARSGQWSVASGQCGSASGQRQPSNPQSPIPNRSPTDHWPLATGHSNPQSPIPNPSSYVVLGCDGFGRSEARPELRRFFEVDAENIALAALAGLVGEGRFPREKLPAAIRTLGLDPNKPSQVTV